MSLPREYIKLLSPKTGNTDVSDVLNGKPSIHTVCEEALCPNRGECFRSGTATFLIMGNICTRNCAFCSIQSGKPEPIDGNEIKDIVDAVKMLNLEYVVLTSVTRDDIDDGGASYFNAVSKAIKRAVPGIKIELLVPDLAKNVHNLDCIERENADVLNHNIETACELYSSIRKGADYHVSLDILREARRRGFITKSGIMLGIGEDDSMIKRTIRDIRDTGTDILTIGQYIKPLKHNYDVRQYYLSRDYDYYRDFAIECGISSVVSGIFVRSSYMAHSTYKEIEIERRK